MKTKPHKTVYEGFFKTKQKTYFLKNIYIYFIIQNICIQLVINTKNK